jgi:hypothetical protein
VAFRLISKIKDPSLQAAKFGSLACHPINPKLLKPDFFGNTALTTIFQIIDSEIYN